MIASQLAAAAPPPPPPPPPPQFAGHHRVAACRALGWTEIDAIVIETTERLQADLIEIDENLCRSELTAGQRSSFTKRRKSIWEALHPVNMQRVAVFEEVDLEVAQLAPPQVFGHGGARPQTKSFASETASITGESKSQVNRHVARADALGADLERVVGTSLDKGVELDALKAMDPADRIALIDRAVAGEQVSGTPTRRDAGAGHSRVPTDCAILLAQRPRSTRRR